MLIINYNINREALKMTEEDQELNAMSKIISELKNIPEERRVAIINYVVDRMGIQSININRGISTNFSPQTLSPNAEMSVSSVEEFIRVKNPVNNYHLIACLGYYLEKFEKIPEFGAKEITDAISRARRPPMSNVSRDIKNTQHQYQFITAGRIEKRKKMLTVYGNQVVEALPDQEKAKNIVKDVRKSINRKNNKKETDKEN